MTIVKSGVLRKTTYLHLLPNITLRIPRGTPVYVAENPHRVLRFEGLEEVEVFKFSRAYYARLWGAVFRVVFPEGGRPFYPLSML